MPFTSETVRSLLAPIGPSAPAGAPLCDDDDFDFVQQELRKLDAMSGAAPDWRAIVDRSIRILGEKSLDLRVACYACVGLFVTEGTGGLAGGLELLRLLVDEHWSALHPPARRIRSRLKAIDWMAERLLGVVEHDQRTTSAPGAHDACVNEARALEASVRMRLSDLDEGDRSPDPGGKLHRLVAALEALRTRRAPQRSRTVASDSDAAAPATMPETPEQAAEAFNGLREQLLRIASLRHAVDPRDPWSYRLSRVVLWARASGLSADASGHCGIPGPEAGSSSTILESTRAQSGVESLRTVEQLIQKHPFWLDLHHIAWKLLGSLGSEYAGAAATVQHEVLGLVRQHPQVHHWLFRSAVPLASDETRAWIEQSGEPSGDCTGGARTDGADGDGRSPESVESEARMLAANDDLRGALRRFEEAISGCSGRRRRFDHRLRLARFAAERRQPEVALAQLDVLDEEAERFGLEEWDPDLCVELLVQQIGILRTQRKRDTASDRNARYLDCRRRLQRIRPATALELEGP